MAKLPRTPGAYMSAKDRGVWLLEVKSDGGRYWRMPGGSLIIESAANSALWDKIIAPHLPFRRMLPRRKPE